MSILLDKISQNDNLDIQRYNYYREITIHNLNKIKLRFTDSNNNSRDMIVFNIFPRFKIGQILDFVTLATALRQFPFDVPLHIHLKMIVLRCLQRTL